MLFDLYETYRLAQTAPLVGIAERFYPPLLVREPEDWSSAKNRIAFVGQETLDWQFNALDAAKWKYAWGRADYLSLADFFNSDESVRDLMDGYRIFDFASFMPRTHRSPFWRYFREAKEVFVRRGETVSAIFSNVIRCASMTRESYSLWSVDRSTRRAYLDWQKGLLRMELSVLAPTLIIFVSGPYYDVYLAEEFDGLEMIPVGSFGGRALSRLHAPGLGGIPAYRTYHPAYLNRVRELRCAPIEAAIADAVM